MWSFCAFRKWGPVITLMLGRSKLTAASLWVFASAEPSLHHNVRCVKDVLWCWWNREPDRIFQIRILPGSVGLSQSAWYYACTCFFVLFCFALFVFFLFCLFSVISQSGSDIVKVYIFPPLCFYKWKIKAYFLLLKCSLFPILYPI